MVEWDHRGDNAALKGLTEKQMLINKWLDRELKKTQEIMLTSPSAYVLSSKYQPRLNSQSRKLADPHLSASLTGKIQEEIIDPLRKSRFKHQGTEAKSGLHHDQSCQPGVEEGGDHFSSALG